MGLAKRYQGLAILWEHRFYGASLPFPVNVRLSFVVKKKAFVSLADLLGKHHVWSMGISYHRTSPWRYRFLCQLIFPAGIDSSSCVDWYQHVGPIKEFPGTPQQNPLGDVRWVVPGYTVLLHANPQSRGDIRFLGIICPCTCTSGYVELLQSGRAQSYKELLCWLGCNNQVRVSIPLPALTSIWLLTARKNRYVDNVLNGNNETATINVKFDLLKAHLSGPGGNTTGADNLTMETAKQTSNVDAASILMDPLDFYQVCQFAESILFASTQRNGVAVLWLSSIAIAVLQYFGDTEPHRSSCGGRRRFPSWDCRRPEVFPNSH